MKKIKLVVGSNYCYGGKKYVKGVVYTVADALSKKLLASLDSRDIPYFSLSTDEAAGQVDEPEASNSLPGEGDAPPAEGEVDPDDEDDGSEIGQDLSDQVDPDDEVEV